MYGSEYCRLCERAEALLAQAGVAATEVDIGDDEALIEQYGTCIPVLRRTDTGEELGWPFDLFELQAFLD
ncbi:MAG: glutaredoxin family protein [Gallionella sp.]|nr:glutaredoxin family protein [Gallionella sp.]